MAYKDFDDLSGDIQTSAQPNIIQAGDTPVTLPDASYIRDANITRDGMDLTLDGPNGTLTIEGYFAVETSPDLVAPDGQILTPDLVESFATSPQVYASTSTLSDASPVGAVNEINGDATVTRLDGSIEPIAQGTPIFQGDIVETSTDGAVNIVFSDETSFAVSEDARLAIDEYVYDPATQEGTQDFSVLKGVFVFTSGLIGREDPDDVNIDTPSGSIGIRGTIIAGDVNAGEITVVEGAIVVRDFGGNEITLDNQFETARFNTGGGIENIGQISANDVAQKFSGVSNVAPTLFSSINDAAAEPSNQAPQNQGPATENADAQDSPANADNANQDENFDADGTVDGDGDAVVDGTVEGQDTGDGAQDEAAVQSDADGRPAESPAGPNAPAGQGPQGPMTGPAANMMGDGPIGMAQNGGMGDMAGATEMGSIDADGGMDAVDANGDMDMVDGTQGDGAGPDGNNGPRGSNAAGTNSTNTGARGPGNNNGQDNDTAGPDAGDTPLTPPDILNPDRPDLDDFSGPIHIRTSPGAIADLLDYNFGHPLGQVNIAPNGSIATGAVNQANFFAAGKGQSWAYNFDQEFVNPDDIETPNTLVYELADFMNVRIDFNADGDFDDTTGPIYENQLGIDVDNDGVLDSTTQIDFNETLSIENFSQLQGYLDLSNPNGKGIDGSDTNVGWAFDSTTGELEFFFNTSFAYNMEFEINIRAVDPTTGEPNISPTDPDGFVTYTFEALSGTDIAGNINGGNGIYHETVGETITLGDTAVTLDNTILMSNDIDTVQVGVDGGFATTNNQINTAGGDDAINIKDSAQNNIINGGDGDDSFTIGNARNKLWGMDGNDKFELDISDLSNITSILTGANTGMLIDGGTEHFGHLTTLKNFLDGTSIPVDFGKGDTLKLTSTSAQTLDFTLVDNKYIRGIENIEMEVGGNSQSITLSYQDIIEITDFKNTLIFSGDSTDSVNFIGSEFLDFSKIADDLGVDEDGSPGADATYDVYSDGNVTLFIEQDGTNDVNVTGLV